MNFIIDKQTLNDLNILGKYNNGSIFNVYNHTKTLGGEKVMEKMFDNPHVDENAINKRAGIFKYFRDKKIKSPFTKECLADLEHYLSTSENGNLPVIFLNNCRRKFMYITIRDKEYEMIYDGITSAVKFLTMLKEFNINLRNNGGSESYNDVINETDNILQNSHVKWALTHLTNSLSLLSFIRYDYIFRSVFYEDMRRLLDIVYHIDVYSTVAEVADKCKFTEALACKNVPNENCINITGFFHPQLANAVANTISVDYKNNVLFLTGANMAGKSTFMKSFGIAVYMAHMGFPVAAEKMTFSVCDGMFSSINISDDLQMGYSHFYAEVMRVKKVAEQVSSGKNLVVIFDELFKGTNVKDAYDATTAIVEAFSVNRNCSFIISTHIIEAGHTLKEKCSNFKFVFFPTIMHGTIPFYTYRLEDGISGDRHGMLIIRNEKIIETLLAEN